MYSKLTHSNYFYYLVYLYKGINHIRVIGHHHCNRGENPLKQKGGKILSLTLGKIVEKILEEVREETGQCDKVIYVGNWC
jgi:hypothetical protein